MADTDYLAERDLNPTVNGAAARINQPFDPRALHYFGFLSEGQEIINNSGFRVYLTFEYAYDQGAGLPLPHQPTVDAILDPGQTRYEENHERKNVIVWLDPAAMPAVGIPVNVRVRAWAKSQ